MKSSHSIAVATLIAGLAGCASVPDTIIQQPLSARPQQSALAAPANGAIFQAAAYRPMFEDRRARLVGDIITITINERTSAGKAATTSSSKSGATNFGVSQLFGVPASTVADLGFGSAGSNKLDERARRIPATTSPERSLPRSWMCCRTEI